MKYSVFFILIGLIVQIVSAGFSLTVPIGFTGRLHFGDNVDEDKFYITNYIGLECRVGNEDEYAIGEFTFNCPLFLLYAINPVDENLQIDFHGIYAKCSFQKVLADCDWFRYSLGPSISSINVDGYYNEISFTGFGIMNELIFFNNFILRSIYNNHFSINPEGRKIIRNL